MSMGLILLSCSGQCLYFASLAGLGSCHCSSRITLEFPNSKMQSYIRSPRFTNQLVSLFATMRSSMTRWIRKNLSSMYGGQLNCSLCKDSRPQQTFEFLPLNCQRSPFLVSFESGLLAWSVYQKFVGLPSFSKIQYFLKWGKSSSNLVKNGQKLVFKIGKI